MVEPVSGALEELQGPLPPLFFPSPTLLEPVENQAAERKGEKCVKSCWSYHGRRRRRRGSADGLAAPGRGQGVHRCPSRPYMDDGHLWAGMRARTA